MTTITLAVPADATSETLLGYLHATPGWTYHLTLGEGTAYPVAVFVRTQSPGRGTNVYVPRIDADPDHLRDAAEIVNTFDHPAVLAGEWTTEADLECCRGEHYANPGKAYVHTGCGRLLRPWGDVHEHPLCVCYGGTLAVVEMERARARALEMLRRPIL